MIWESASNLPEIGGDQHILVIYGTGKTTDLGSWTEWLTIDEIEHARQIRSEEERNTWISCHATLRRLLGNWLHLKPAEIELKKSTHGKLFLSGSNLYFNLSHTAKSYLLGFNFNGRIGVDLEFLSGSEDLPLLIGYAFSGQETDFCNQGNKPENFLKIWTLKEAYLKATGVGLVDFLKSVNIYGDKDNAIDNKQFSQNSFTCPNGETASIVYRNEKPIDYIWLK